MPQLEADFHLHCSWSDDSDELPEVQAEAAIQAGLKQICFTDHFDPGYPGGGFEVPLGPYYESIGKVSEKYAGRLTIHRGLEIGLRPDYEQKILEANNAFPWEFVIGSTHVMDGEDPWYPQTWEGRDVKQLIRRYYEVTLDNVKRFDFFNVYGHIDYISRYIPQNSSYVYRYADFYDLLDLILRQLIEEGRGIECNTSGYKYGLSQPHPEEALIRHYLNLGGEILTVGSDAHDKEHVGYAFDRARDFLSACGAKFYTVFDHRKPIMYKL